MKRRFVRSVGYAGLVIGLLIGGRAEAGSPQAVVPIGSFTAAAGTVFVPTIVHSFAAAPAVVAHAAPATVLVVPQAVAAPTIVSVPTLVAPHIVRQRVRTVTLPARGVRTLFCR